MTPKNKKKIREQLSKTNKTKKRYSGNKPHDGFEYPEKKTTYQKKYTSDNASFKKRKSQQTDSSSSKYEKKKSFQSPDEKRKITIKKRNSSNFSERENKPTLRNNRQIEIIKSYEKFEKREGRIKDTHTDEQKFGRERKSIQRKNEIHIKKQSERKSSDRLNKSDDRKQFKKFEYQSEPGFEQKKHNTNFKTFEHNPNKEKKIHYHDREEMRLNKYLAHCGVCARRKADEFIEAGMVKVNGEIVKEMGHKVLPGDKVSFKGKLIKPQNYVYLLLNKPKDYITTADDEKGRKTVMELIEGATLERIYPVGRLDRNTTGLLLLTNDGDLAQKLSHPSHGAKKVYAVELDRALTYSDMQKIQEGIELEDGIAMIDDIAYAHAVRKDIIGIMLHVGKNRIVRRIFEALGYQVKKLDRTLYAGLEKKNLDRGKWRFLNEKEIKLLKRH